MNAAQLNGNGNTDTFSDILSSAVAECLNGNDHQEDVLFDDLDELDLLANGSSESGSMDKPLINGIPFNRTTQSVQRLAFPSQQLNMSSDSGSSTSTVGRLVSFDLSNCSIASTDHEMEAVQFLRSTLNLYGPELSIADLFSYRRRAPMTVRSLILNCGETKALLEKYPQHFVVHGDKVRLKKPEDDLPEANLNAAGMTLARADGTDAYTEQQYDQLMKADTIEFFGGILKKHGAMMKIGGLFACRVQAPQAVRRSYARSEAVFSKFLFDNPETFLMEGDCVSLRERMVTSTPALGSVSHHGYLSQAFPVQQPVLLRSNFPALQPEIPVPSVASTPFYANQPRFVSNSFPGLVSAPIASANHAQFAAAVELSQVEPLPDQNATKSYTPWSTSVDKPDQQEAIDYFRNVLIQRDGMKMSISRLYSRHCCEAPRYIQQLAGAHSLASFATFLADNPQAFVLPGSNFVCVKYPPISTTSSGIFDAKPGSTANSSQQRVKKILSIVNPEQPLSSALLNGHAGKQLPIAAKQPSQSETTAANGFSRVHHGASGHRRLGGALNQNGFLKESYGFSEVFINKQKADSAEQQWAKWPLAAASPAANVDPSMLPESDVASAFGSLTIRDDNPLLPACGAQANSMDVPDHFGESAVNTHAATDPSSEVMWAVGEQPAASSERSNCLPGHDVEHFRPATNEDVANNEGNSSEKAVNGSLNNSTSFSSADVESPLCEPPVQKPARKVYSALEMWAIREQWLSSAAQPDGLPELADKEFCQHRCNFRSLFNELLPKYQLEKARADGLAQEVLSLKELLRKSMNPTDDTTAAADQ